MKQINKITFIAFSIVGMHLHGAAPAQSTPKSPRSNPAEAAQARANQPNMTQEQFVQELSRLRITIARLGGGRAELLNRNKELEGQIRCQFVRIQWCESQLALLGEQHNNALFAQQQQFQGQIALLQQQLTHVRNETEEHAAATLQRELHSLAEEKDAEIELYRRHLHERTTERNKLRADNEALRAQLHLVGLAGAAQAALPRTPMQRGRGPSTPMQRGGGPRTATREVAPMAATVAFHATQQQPRLPFPETQQPLDTFQAGMYEYPNAAAAAQAQPAVLPMPRVHLEMPRP